MSKGNRKQRGGEEKETGGLLDFLFKPFGSEPSLYDRLGGSYPIAAVVNRFSDALLTNPVVGANSKNKELSKWHSEDFETRLPGLKFLRTLWVNSVAGGPFEYTGKDLADAHYRFHISPKEFDAVAGELAKALDYYHVPPKEKKEVMDAFIAQKEDVTTGWREEGPNPGHKGTSAVRCPFGST